jgi:hypothetical protein
MDDAGQQELLSEKAKATALISHMIIKEQIKRQRQLTPQEVFALLQRKLVCPKCESFAHPHKGWTRENPVGQCAECGYHGPMMTVREYVKGGYYK